MAIYEQDKVLYEEDANGNKTIFLPVTRANNVEGMGRIASAAYSVNDVVYVDSNSKIALKCTVAGTTSSSEVDFSGKVAGNTVKDGSVTWLVINRSNVLDENGAVSVSNGGTGATNAQTACRNLGIFNANGHLVLPSGAEIWIE